MEEQNVHPTPRIRDSSSPAPSQKKNWSGFLFYFLESHGLSGRRAWKTKSSRPDGPKAGLGPGSGVQKKDLSLSLHFLSKSPFPRKSLALKCATLDNINVWAILEVWSQCVVVQPAIIFCNQHRESHRYQNKWFLKFLKLSLILR